MHYFMLSFRSLCTLFFSILISGMSTARAAILYVPSESYLVMHAAAGHATYGPYDDQYISLYGQTSYSNTLNAAASDSLSSAIASSSLDMTVDVAGGIFTASGSYDTASTGFFGASAHVQVDMRFIITTPYSYTLDLYLSPGTNASSSLWGTFQNSSDGIYIYNQTNGFNIHQSGMLLPNNYYYPNANAGIYAMINGCPDVCSGDPSGNFQFNLTLTPVSVPLPASMLLFGSGMVGLLGWARCGRKMTTIKQDG